ncbi:MAG: hypothetical protein JSS82_15150 [Bacteroidetes bacterium]|nr:hypothetical protein [Bacteroidota bacterium]
MIDVDTAWEKVKAGAIKALAVNLEWQSLVHKRRYSVQSVQEDRIVLARKSGGKDEALSRDTVEEAIHLFNANNCFVQRRHLISPTVAEETALVLFHPEMAWDDNGDFIIQV